MIRHHRTAVSCTSTRAGSAHAGSLTERAFSTHKIGGWDMGDTIKDTGADKDTSVEQVGPAVARVREDDLEPHEGLRYIAKLFKALAVLLIFMFVAELVIGFRHDG